MTADPRTLAAVADHCARFMPGEDRRAELRNVKAYIESMVPLYDAWLKANPPCPTCGGTTIYQPDQFTGKPCPDCTDGVVPFAEWLAERVREWSAQ